MGELKKNLYVEQQDGIVLSTNLNKAKIDNTIIRFSDINSKCYFEIVDTIIEQIKSSCAEILIFQTHWHSYLAMLKVAENLKKEKYKCTTIFLGNQATNSVEETIKNFDFVDFVYFGEPEEQIVKIVKEIQCQTYNFPENLLHKKNIETLEKIRYSFNNFIDVNKLPLIQFERYGLDELDFENQYFPIDIGRGCPFGCYYCNISLYRNRKYRIMDVDEIIFRMKFYNRKYGINKFMFMHDSLCVNKSKILTLCERLSECSENFLWQCTMRIDNLDIDLFETMYAAGLRGFSFGIESGSRRMQKIINKKIDLEKAYELLKIISQKKIFLKAFFMYGFPEEKEADINLTLQYAFDLMKLGISVQFSQCAFSSSSVLSKKYFDNLYFNPSNPTLKNVIGWKEEIDRIKNHKELFYYLYDYNSVLRAEIKFLNCFVKECQKYKYTTEYLNREYLKKGGSPLQLYYDYLSANNLRHCADLQNTNSEHFIIFMKSLINKNLNKKVLKFFEFESKLEEFLHGKDNHIIISCDFSYQDLKKFLPIDQIGNEKTHLILTRNKSYVNITQI